MSKKLSKETLKAELSRREKVKDQYKSYDITKDLFDKQLAFVTDPARNKVAVCSRRAGKSRACAADLIHTAINNPEVTCLYISLAKASGEKIVWTELLKINKRYNLGGKPNMAKLHLKFNNGSIIYILGAKDSSEMEKFRGLAVKLAYIDEAQSFRSHIKTFILDILTPALLDHAGTLCLIGTPGPIAKGFFYDCWKNKDNLWSKHFWTFFDNPYILEKSNASTHQELLEYTLASNNLTINDPNIRREYFGEWITDTQSLLLKYDENTNHFDQLPTTKMNYIMGIDFGFDDADAIAILSWSDESPVTYLVEEIVVSKQGITELVEQISMLQKKYKCYKMIVDQGGLGKKIAEEIRRRYQIPLVGADKSRKMENMALLNDALRTGKFKAKKDSQFAEDTRNVEIDRNKTTPERLRVSERYHSDIMDAVLYAFKESPAYGYIPAPKVYRVGEIGWGGQEEDRMWEAALQHFRRKREEEEGGFF